MGNLGRRIGLSQDKGNSKPAASGGSVGGGRGGERTESSAPDVDTMLVPIPGEDHM